MSFAPGELSTIEGKDGATRVFSFADLPCPPASVVSADSYFYNSSFDPGQAYEPRLAPPSEIFNLDPEWENCVPATNQGFDPPIALPPVFGPSDSDQSNRPLFPPRDFFGRNAAPGATPAQKIQYVPLGARETGAPSK